jgi:hypothetical protein
MARPTLHPAKIMDRPLGRLGLVLLVAMIATAPAVLFFDPAPPWPGQRHIPRDPADIYLLYSDDVAYVGSSRTFERTVSNLFVPHNTHIVPVWRVVTWALTASAGTLERVPKVLALASYSILVAVVLLTGRLVIRETGRPALGLASMILVGTTSLMLTPAIWYSAGQTLWAGFGILATLWYAQSFRRSKNRLALVLAMISAPAAGWCWTIGHLAGPVAALYLWADGRRRCRIAAALPLAASLAAVAVSLTLGSNRIQSAISFHGRTAREAFSLVQGALHTMQAIPENLVFGNLGLAVQTTEGQGAILTLGIIAGSLSRLWIGRRTAERPSSGKVGTSGLAPPPLPGVSPLELAGAALVIGAYLVEWSFRGYMDYQYLRTLNLRFIVPWYDAIPQIGAVLWLAGWCNEVSNSVGRKIPARAPARLTRWAALGLVVLMATMLALHRPRVDYLVRQIVPPLLPSELRMWPIARLQMMRANVLLQMHADWQRGALRRLDHAQNLAHRLELGQDGLRSVFGHPYLPSSVGLLHPSMYDLYDTIALLDIPERGRPTNPALVPKELRELLAEIKEPRPEWIAKDEVWPPKPKSETPEN